jgi:hypothetical protein
MKLEREKKFSKGERRTAVAPFLRTSVPDWEDETEGLTESKSRTHVAQFILWITMRRHVDYRNVLNHTISLSSRSCPVHQIKGQLKDFHLQKIEN